MDYDSLQKKALDKYPGHNCTQNLFKHKKKQHSSVYTFMFIISIFLIFLFI